MKTEAKLKRIYKRETIRMNKITVPLLVTVILFQNRLKHSEIISKYLLISLETNKTHCILEYGKSIFCSLFFAILTSDNMHLQLRKIKH